MEEKNSMVLGPVQALVIEFDGNKFTGEIMPELRRLQDEGIARVVDLLVVQKSPSGEIRTAEISGLDERQREEFGAIAGALVGVGIAAEATSDEAAADDIVEAGAAAGAADMEDGMFDEADVWSVAEVIPPNSTAAVLLLEHRWAAPFRDAVLRAGGRSLADEWIHPLDLVAAGAKMHEDAVT